jgi:hypothetical protein
MLYDWWKSSLWGLSDDLGRSVQNLLKPHLRSIDLYLGNVNLLVYLKVLLL